MSAGVYLGVGTVAGTADVGADVAVVGAVDTIGAVGSQLVLEQTVPRMVLKLVVPRAVHEQVLPRAVYKMLCHGQKRYHHERRWSRTWYSCHMYNRRNDANASGWLSGRIFLFLRTASRIINRFHQSV